MAVPPIFAPGKAQRIAGGHADGVGIGGVLVLDRVEDPGGLAVETVGGLQGAVSYTHLTLPTNREVER